MSQSPYRFSVAPMMDWTDRHCRVFHRKLSARALLYTEMLTTGAIIHGDRQRLLGFNVSEHPVALQLGGSDPAHLSTAAKIGEDFGYDEINMNVGCPSDRVQEGRFGACLMAEPKLVADCVAAMKRAVVEAGANALVVHARKAWLQGLSPKENREVPPLDYDLVYRLKAELPHVPVIINGGIPSIEEARAHLGHVDGVMLGRAAYQEPWRLLDADRVLFDEAPPAASMKDAIEAFIPYVEQELARGIRLHAMTRHLVGAFHAVPGARAFRRHLAENATRSGAGVSVLRDAMALVGARETETVAA